MSSLVGLFLIEVFLAYLFTVVWKRLVNRGVWYAGESKLRFYALTAPLMSVASASVIVLILLLFWK